MQRNSPVVHCHDTPYLLPSKHPTPPPLPSLTPSTFKYLLSSISLARYQARHFFLGGGGGASKVFYGRCANGKFNDESTPQTKLNLWLSPPSSQRRNSCSGTYAHRWFVKKAIANLSNKLKRNAFPVNCWALYVAGPEKKDICYRAGLGLRLRRRLKCNQRRYFFALFTWEVNVGFSQ